jgi:hypothetical protein
VIRQRHGDRGLGDPGPFGNMAHGDAIGVHGGAPGRRRTRATTMASIRQAPGRTRPAHPLAKTTAPREKTSPTGSAAKALSRSSSTDPSPPHLHRRPRENPPPNTLVTRDGPDMCSSSRTRRFPHQVCSALRGIISTPRLASLDPAGPRFQIPP